MGVESGIMGALEGELVQFHGGEKFFPEEVETAVGNFFAVIEMQDADVIACRRFKRAFEEGVVRLLSGDFLDELRARLGNVR